MNAFDLVISKRGTCAANCADHRAKQSAQTCAQAASAEVGGKPRCGSRAHRAHNGCAFGVSGRVDGPVGF